MNIVTVTNDAYAIGVYALLNSILRNGGLSEFKFYVGVYDKLSNEWKHLISSLHETVFFQLTDIGTFKTRGAVEKAQLIPSMQKLMLFKPNKYFQGDCLFVDADALCLNNIQDASGFRHFSVAPDISRYIQPAVNNLFYFNCGVFVFQPGDIFDELANYGVTNRGNYKYGDNTLLVEYFYRHRPKDVTLLDYRWNMLSSIKSGMPKAYRLDEAKFLHFAGRRKPWQKDYKDKEQSEIFYTYAPVRGEKSHSKKCKKK
jgi:lipopolysaccharide biosynthesis glycosyltransferase